MFLPNVLMLVSITFLFTACDLFSTSQKAECWYSAKATQQNPEPEFENQGFCGEFFDEDTLLVYSRHLDNMDYLEENLSVLQTDNGVFYVSKEGSIVRTHFFDNSADYFEEGLARTIKRKKFGFINKKLDVVIAPQYDFAFPFQNAKAVVCHGCEQVKEKNGEHTKVVGGKWGAIDTKGECCTTYCL